jgi:hypothetical protein
MLWQTLLDWMTECCDSLCWTEWQNVVAVSVGLNVRMFFTVSVGLNDRMLKFLLEWMENWSLLYFESLHLCPFPILTSFVPLVGEFCGHRPSWSLKTTGSKQKAFDAVWGYYSEATLLPNDRQVFESVCVFYKTWLTGKRGQVRERERDIQRQTERGRENKTIPISVITLLKSFYHHILVNFLQYLLSFEIDFWALHSI